MATTDENAKKDIPFVREFLKYLPNDGEYEGLRDWAMSVPESIILDGEFQRDRLMELALAEQSNKQLTVVSINGCDFSDGSDMKTTTVNRAPDNMKRFKYGRIMIPGVKNKIGPLRVVVYDTASEKFRYIVIWKWKSTLPAIPISNDPTTESKYLNGECGRELGSFKELAQWTELKEMETKLDEYNPNLFLGKVNFQKLIQYDNLGGMNSYQPIDGQPIQEIMKNCIDFKSQIC